MDKLQYILYEFHIQVIGLLPKLYAHKKSSLSTVFFKAGERKENTSNFCSHPKWRTFFTKQKKEDEDYDGDEKAKKFFKVSIVNILSIDTFQIFYLFVVIWLL